MRTRFFGRPLSRRQFARTFFSTGAAAVVLGQASPYRFAVSDVAAANLPAIVVNQAGYRQGLPKRALLLAAADVGRAELVDANRMTAVREIDVGPAQADVHTGHSASILDFTAHDTPGRYFLRAGNWQSYTFAVEQTVYELPMVLMLRSYYLQRCGVAVRDRISGVSHPACHRADAAVRHADDVHGAGTRIDLTGGWHDAGDFGKYVGPTAVTLGRLLTLFEQHPQLFRDRQLSIPESGDGIPDIVSETAVGLDWLVAMQRADGAFYRKVSGETWPGVVMPEADAQPRYAYGPATSDSAKAAAALALGARVWRTLDPARAARYLSAAVRGWRHLAPIPEQVVAWRDGDDTGSGKYLFSEIDDEITLTHDRDDRLWAAAELYLTTGETAYGEAFARLARTFEYGLFEWKDPSPLGLSSYLFAASADDRLGLRSLLVERLLGRADLLLQRVRVSSYGLAVGEFKWGSNKMVAEEGVTLALAYRLTRRFEYLVAATGQLDYLLGRNHFNKSFVTGVGADPAMNIHHRIAQAMGAPLPGLLVGGPNNGAQAGIAPKGQGPLSYADDVRSYATNESAIDYNASMLGLIGELATMQPA